jgi:putative sigma-54 modulation protein
MLGSARGVGIIVAVKVVINDRTEAVPTEVRTYAERKLDRLGRHFDRVLSAEVEFCRESNRHTSASCTAHITVQMDGRKHPMATASETAARPREALDLALDKVDRQVLKLKEKIKERKKGGVPAAGDSLLGEEQTDQARRGGLERVTVRARPMTIEQAETALSESESPFLVFRDEDSGELQIGFRRDDGGFTVVEPL